MSITSLSGINSTQSQSIKNAGEKLQKVIADIVSGERDDPADISVATRLRSETAGLRQASSNIAQTASLTQVAEGGAAQIQEVVGQLRNLALQARNPALNDANRAQLNEQFQKLAQQIDNIANSTSFNGKALLNGNLSGDEALSLDKTLGSSGGTDSKLEVKDLSSSSLFGGSQPNLLTVDNATQAIDALTLAANKITATRADIGAFQSSLDFAGANVDTAIINQEAARSTIIDTDFAEASTERTEEQVKREAAIALQAQGNKLSPALLKLVN